jgi:hypothetical protein
MAFTVEEIVAAGIAVKQCTKCELFKPLTEFQSVKAGKFGVSSTCRLCVKNPDNKERRKKHSAKVYQANKSSAYYYEDRRKNPAKYLWKGAKKRAKQRGLEFNITIEDIVVPEVCPILGIPLGFTLGEKIHKHAHTDNTPSIDRVDPTKGYIKGNIAIMSARANIIKNEGTAEEHCKIAEFMDKWGKDQS